MIRRLAYIYANYVWIRYQKKFSALAQISKIKKSAFVHIGNLWKKDSQLLGKFWRTVNEEYSNISMDLDAITDY